ncbi:hypothetical protein L596_000378 [Steinernema carpocapsae]|uniref:Uncharacterized protein n=1 Tax=Steinernema carpocapsae TaxID=34508 RepID=A0A4V6I734_STECR|nr:hypothetical protein L596_000378 [Steinernema carpocapsae]
MPLNPNLTVFLKKIYPNHLVLMAVIIMICVAQLFGFCAPGSTKIALFMHAPLVIFHLLRCAYIIFI